MLTGRTKWTCFALLGLSIGVARGDLAHGNQRHDCTGIVKLADELQHDGRDLGAEIRGMYRSTPQFWTLQSHTREIVSRAAHLEVLARAGADLNEMKCDLDVLSRTYRLLAQTVRAADISYGPRTHGPAVRYVNVPIRQGQVPRLLECMDKTICQINDELAKLYVPRHRPGSDHDRRSPGHHGPTGVGPSGFTVGNPANHGQTGLSIANGRITFNFGR